MMHAPAVLSLVLSPLLHMLAAALDANCTPASCGNLSIRYPFWVRGHQPSYYGYPSFGLACDPTGASAPSLNDSYLCEVDDPTGSRATKFNIFTIVMLSLLAVSRATGSSSSRRTARGSLQRAAALLGPAVLLLTLLARSKAAVAAQNTSSTPPCAPASCGNLTVASPFWLAGGMHQPPECGSLKDFQVACDDKGRAFLKNSFWDYQILNIFYENSSFVVTNVDMWEWDDGNCNPSWLFSNATTDLALGPFTISPQNQKLFFVFGCDPPATRVAHYWPWARVSCADRSNDSFALLAAGNYTAGDTSPVMTPPGNCNLSMTPVLGYQGATGADYQALFKRGFLLNYKPHDECSDGEDSFNCGINGKSSKITLIVSMSVAACVLLPFIYVLVWHRERLSFFLRKNTGSTIERNVEALIVSHGSLAPKRYRYSEATRITSSLSNKLGEGGYGMVFKGRLDDGRQVAVKFLHDSKGEGEEFVNEVMSIGRTSHVNIVSLFGFCLEGSKRALIYEYMPNGSLDKYIYSENPKAILGWDKLHMIAIGIARGLEYLHHGCNTRIVHFDIKPQNILLGEDFHPKIADFGLAKLCCTKESKLSMTGARGTVGFIAPEVHSRTFGVVSTKSDVYSYGMMLLEMVGGRKNVKSAAQNSSEKYFPHWIYDHFGQDDGLEACEVTGGNEGIAKKMSVIGLWCIQILPIHRPTITKVLEMFERRLNDLDMPPRQNFSQILEDLAYGLNAESSSMSYVTRVLVPLLSIVISSICPVHGGHGAPRNFPCAADDDVSFGRNNSQLTLAIWSPRLSISLQLQIIRPMAPSLLLFFVSVFAASSVPLMLEAAAAAAEDGRSLCPPTLCGGFNISSPFGIVDDHATAASCGEIGFQVVCVNNATPYLGHNHEYSSLQILDIFYDNHSLVVADVPKVQIFNNIRSCHISESSNTSSKVGAPFAISPANQNLILYNCTEAPPPAAREGLAETVCGNGTFVRVAHEPASNRSAAGYYGSYFLEGCKATVVPVLGGYGDVDATNYKELISHGFLLTWSPPALPPPLPERRHMHRHKHKHKLILVVMVFTSTSFTLACLIWIMYRRREKYTVFIQNYTVNVSSIEEIFRGYHSLVPKRYKYSELKKITGSFKDRLGEGGYGMVFKGKLEDGHEVAVKLLKGSKGNGEDFMNEVISIRGTSHVNIVNLLGFCLHGPTRALVYEYMVNGSLDKYIYSEESKMIIGWEKLKQIAIGIARGLEYLHRGCNTRIIHFDIKPHNILLDEDFCPKIADFGLAKLCHLKDSALSMAEARGTIGFIAPEVFSRGFGVVSTKSDVYSYGMMLLEMVGGRKNLIQHTENSSNAYFPNCAYDRLVKDLQSHEVMCETEEIERQMTLVGLWCIQTAPGNRPSMSRVIEMLEKNVNELEMPPKPFLSCPSEAPYFSS
ncbi:hypothetical protein BS78_03G072200 [Paspalum vaginatum]|nr:hypothetical protein BS78_03G072200 [Paspalum vaginatum]